MKIPDNYAWLTNETGPKILLEALKSYGIKEIIGPKHNPKIIAMADFLGGTVKKIYLADETSWCGLGMAFWLKKAGWKEPTGYNALRALQYANWGLRVKAGDESIADIGVFARTGGGHVGLLVGEDAAGFYHVLGCNQGDACSFTRIAKSRLAAVVRPPYKIFKPRRLPVLSATGKISQNEA